MRVLVLSQHFWPESFRINEVVECLRDAGCEVDVLTGQPNYPEGRIFEGYSAVSSGLEEHPLGYSIFRVPVVPRGTGGAVRRAANYVSFAVASTLLAPWLLRGRRYDVVFVYAISPIIQALAGVLLRVTKGAALVPWVQDLWPDSLAATGFVRSRMLLRSVGAVTGWLYRRSDLVLVQSHGFFEPVRRLAGPTTQIAYHPNPGDLVTDGCGRASAPSLNDGFNVVFTGNLGAAQALPTILRAAELLREHSNVRIVLVGGGSRLDWLQNEIRHRALQNVDLLGLMPPSSMPAVWAQASALLLTLGRSDIFSRTIPSKLPSYLSAGRPIVAAVDGEAAAIIKESGAGYSVAAEDADGLADAIVRMKSLSATERTAMGDRGRQYFSENFEPRHLTERLMDHFRHAVALRQKRYPEQRH